jgi:hypothetical protein
VTVGHPHPVQRLGRRVGLCAARAPPRPAGLGSRADGRSTRLGQESHHSLNGGLRVGRFTYREVGVRNGPIVVPLDLAAGLVEGATPALEYSVTLGYSQGELRGYVESMEAQDGAPEMWNAPTRGLGKDRCPSGAD